MFNDNFSISAICPEGLSHKSNRQHGSKTGPAVPALRYLLTLCFCLLGLMVSAQTWNGSVSSDWDNPANWDGGVIPIASTDAIIPNVGTAPVIMAGVNALAQSVWVQGGTSLTIEATGSLSIDGAGQFGLRNNGTLNNSGSISIGAVTGGSTYGIWNQGTFNHNSGVISINNSITAALRNNKNFTNMAQIDIGGLASVGTYGIQNLNFLINTAGTIHIDRSSTAAIYNGNDNDYGITNYAQIIIGANAPVGQYGIWNDFARFQNLAGEIHIDQTSKYGVFNYAESFKNAALLVIGAVSSVGEFALNNQGVFVNAGGEISLDRSTKAGLLQGFSFTNSGNIQIGSIASVGNFGIDAENGFKNEAGTITIDRCTNAGVLNLGSGFQNWANIFIGSEASVGAFGIKNDFGIFKNHSGEVRINNCSNAGILNDDSSFYNDALINIGSLANIGIYGIKNSGIFENNAGEINIDRSSGTGILNLFSPVDDITFTNLATINIGAIAPLGLIGIENYNEFNNSTGTINIDNVGSHAVYNGLEGVFTNNAAIHIGTLAAIGGIGIQIDDEGVFNNDGGAIHIDNTSTTGISLYNATFTNTGELHIGSMADIGSNGISINMDAVFDNSGGEIYIDRSTFAGISNAGTFNSSGLIKIGSTGDAGSSGLSNDGSFSITTGEVYIDRSSGEGIRNKSGGTLISSGQIHIGSLAASGSMGIKNLGHFENAGGAIHIDNIVSKGIDNTNTFISSGLIKIGSNAGTFQIGLENRQDFILTGGELYIDRSTSQAIQNFGPFSNAAQIYIGSIAACGNNGIQNASNFTNASGSINIDQSTNAGIVTENGGNFINNGDINIGATMPVGVYGIYIEFNSSFNHDGGTVHIDNATFAGIYLEDAAFTNAGELRIGASYGVGNFGIRLQGSSSFENTAGEISIDQATQAGIFNNSGASFENSGNIHIATIGTVGDGIRNKGDFQHLGGEIVIAQFYHEGIENGSAAVFNSAAQLVIGSLSFYNATSIFNEGIFYVGGNTTATYEVLVTPGATFTIQASGSLSIDGGAPKYCLYNDGTLNNYGLINMGAVTGGSQAGIVNDGTCNNFSGQIITNNMTLAGLYSGGPFVNMAEITIGSTGSVGDYGLFIRGSFDNLGGTINIDQCSLVGVYEEDADAIFTNTGQLNVGANAAVGDYGIWNLRGSFQNSGGNIQIDRTLQAGIFNAAGTFSNSAEINIGLGSYVGAYGIQNTANFTNNACATIRNNAAVSNSASFSNAGLFTVNTLDAHTNSALNNNGIIAYPQGNPIPNVLNNDFVVAPIGGECFMITDALQKGAMLSFTAGSTWYQDAGLGIPAGTYDQASNIFTASSLPEGTHTLYFSIDDDDNGCQRTVSILVTLDDVTPPSITCPANTTIAADVNCSNTLGAYLALSKSDNCTASPTESQSPASGTILSGHNTAETVTLTADDGNGNTAACSFTVTLKDVTKPVISCPANKILVADANCSNSLGSYAAIAVSDNCSASPAVTQSPVNGTIISGHNTVQTVTLTANDTNGNTANCSFTVTLKDQTKPTVACKNAVVNLNAAGIGSHTTADVYLSGSDNCGVVDLVATFPNTFDCSNLGPNIVTLLVHDGNGNTNFCMATVTVVDAIAPTMQCKSATIFLDNNGNASLAPALVNNGSFDNCGIVGMDVSPSAFTCAQVGNNTVELGGRDQSGNKASCTATVTVVDAILPVANCKNLMVNIGPNGTVVIPAGQVDNGSSDNCSFDLALTPYVLTCADIGTNVLTLQATDASGNSATCTTTVMVKDATAPIAKCKNPVIFLNANGHATLNATQVDNGSTDNCSIYSMSLSQTDFNCSELQGSPWAVTMTMHDNSGNTSSCLSYVSVSDAIAPTAVCQNTTVALNSNGYTVVYPSSLAANSTDNCAVWSYSPVARVYTSSNLGNNFLNITVRDYSGNAATCVSVVTVLPFNIVNENADNRDAELIDTKPLALGMRVYPNPTAGDATLEFELPDAQDYTLVVYDLSGRMVLMREGAGEKGWNSLPVLLGNIAPGVYLLAFQSEGLKENRRLIVQE